MTAPRYTADQLHAMSGRDLDAVVAEVVFQENPPEGAVKEGDQWVVHHEQHNYPDSRSWYTWTEHWPPHYSDSWEGLGQVVDRLSYLEIDFLLESATDDENRKLFHVWVGDSKDSGQGFNEFASVTAPTLPRATAIAAILAVQGVGHG